MNPNTANPVPFSSLLLIWTSPTPLSITAATPNNPNISINNDTRPKRKPITDVIFVFLFFI